MKQRQRYQSNVLDGTATSTPDQLRFLTRDRALPVDPSHVAFQQLRRQPDIKKPFERRTVTRGISTPSLLELTRGGRERPLSARDRGDWQVVGALGVKRNKSLRLSQDWPDIISAVREGGRTGVSLGVEESRGLEAGLR